MDFVQGASLMGLGFFSEALPFFAKLSGDERVPKAYAARSRFQQVYCLLRLERYKETVELATAFCKDLPDEPDLADVHYFAGEALHQLGDFQLAAASLQLAISKAGAQWAYYGDAHVRLTDCFEKVNQFKEAAAVYRKLSGEEGIEHRALMLLRAGECERRTENWEGAVRDLENLLKQFPDAEDETRAAILHLGELYSQREQYDRAVALIGELLQRDGAKNRSRLLFFLGYWQYQQSKYAEAEKSLEQALAAQDGGNVSTEAGFYLAGTKLELGKVDEALNLFAELLSLPPEQRPQFDQSLLFRLEEMFYSRHQYGVSEGICRWLLTWDDGDVIYRSSLRLSQILVAQNRLAEAQGLLDGLLSKAQTGQIGKAGDTTDAEIQSLLGEVLLQRKENDRAVSAFDACLAKRGVGMVYATRARWGLSHILKEEGRLSQALYYATKGFVLADAPVYSPRCMFIAVEVLLAQGKPDEAYTTWVELRTRYPSFAEQKRLDAGIVTLLKGRETQ